MLHGGVGGKTRMMKPSDASLRPHESGRSPTNESSSEQVPRSPRRRRDEPSHEREAVVDVDINLDNTSEEEKLKVVVRVRPLQKNEEPWSILQGACHGEDDSEISSSRKHRQHGAALSSTGVAPPTTESSLRLHDRSVSWEKNGQIKTLLADAVFSGDATQNDVFESIQDCIDGLLAGFDCSVFAYGQTGTGKTHTMSGLPHRGSRDEGEEMYDGTSFPMNEKFGVVPRCIQRLFDQIDEQVVKEGPGVSFSVYCSFVEIYNERIYDILSSDVGVSANQPGGPGLTQRQPHDTRAGWNRPQPIKEARSLQIRQKLDGTVFVDGLTSRRISSPAEMLRAFREGSMNREVRDNLYNQHSSRGHSIFQVTLRKNVMDGNFFPAKGSSGSTSPKRPPSTSGQSGSKASAMKSRLSRLFFVDLAGSEKWHVNGSDLNDKYATELSSINKSLSALTNCVLALTQKERAHVPYRDSVLTRLLQSCLQGVGRTAFIVTISPARESLEESFATLRFAERLKSLRCRPIRRKIFANEQVMGEQRVYYENQIHSMRMEVNRLRELLKKAHRRNQEIIADNSAAAANAALLEENRRLKELLMNSERSRLVERGDRLYGKTPKGTQESTSDPSPQRQAAKQILASSQRPFSEEETMSKSIAPSDMDRADHSPSVLPTTPQPRLSQDQKGSHTEHGSVGSTEEKEYSTLVNRLQDKEARLNWMLEAELEAQNTRGNGLPVVASTNTNTQISAASATDSEPSGKSAVTRSWAVERVLRRNLVVVPPPVRRSTHTTHDDEARKVTRSKEPDSVNVRRIVPPPPDPDSVPSPRQRPADGKIDSPRHPSSTTPSVRSSEGHVQPIGERGSHAPKAPPNLHRPMQAPSVTIRTSEVDSAQSSQVKPASLLKLVGTETKGKSKDELVDDYKRARRAELEAMLRTMVHQ